MRESRQCKFCSEPLTETQWRRWIAKYRHFQRHSGTKRNGPFCSTTCRANWQANETDRQFEQESPASIPFYTADFLGGTKYLSANEIGAYVLLLIHQWEKGYLPNDESRLIQVSRMTRGQWAKSRERILEKFPLIGGGRRQNRRMEHERRKANSYA